MNILNIFLENPERGFHIRELSRRVKMSPTTISKKLKKLEYEGILYSKKKYGHLVFKLKEYKKTKRLRQNYNLEKIENSGLMEFLEDFYNFPETILLFGSFEKGEDVQSSDIDILIISSKKNDVDLSRFEKKLGKKIDVFIHTKKSMEKIKTKNKELFNSWINGRVIYGYFEAL